MNVERLNVIANAIKQDLRQTKLVNSLATLVNALESQVSAPQEPSHQQQVAEALGSVSKILGASTINRFSQSWEQVVAEVGGKAILGNQLKNRINEIFARNQITPSVALEELREIHSKLSSFSSSLDELVKAFADLNIGLDALNPGECEVGVLVPRTFVHNQLDDFAAELVELDKTLKVFAELSTGSRPEFEINTISSSDLTIYLAAIPPVAACVAVAVERIVALYKTILEIRKLKNELEKYEIEKEGLKSIENSAKSTMEKGIEVLIKELMRDFYAGEDEGRKNELAVELRYTLRKIANRVDRGFNIEVRCEAEPEPDEGKQSEATEEERKFFETIKSKSKGMEFLRVEGKPILKLPEANRRKSKPKPPEH